ncbi:MAG TPA: double-cubane-cluster-containing anaerobic reductase [Methanomassiliicoccales archaeon]|jgi:benzoyl-CoA reductase/2-hydroxyglutaryl-CoA dehydratase subunit BcrC/BadD/HgdB
MNLFKEAYTARIEQLGKEREAGRRVVGTFCLFVPDEIVFASGADRVILCGGRSNTISVAEEYLPRNICPLIKSSFGAIVNGSCSGDLACPHFGMVDAIVAEATCDGKKKMYELLHEYIPTYVMDLPQMPDSRTSIGYFESELRRFGRFMEGLTGRTITEEALAREIRSGNETRRMLHRLYEMRRLDPPPIRGSDVIKMLQKQYFLSPDVFRNGLREVCDEVEKKTASGEKCGPRLMISGCPMPAGNMKVPQIIEDMGACIVVEESCTGTRSFWDLVDEQKDPWTALAERYLKIPCSCMTPNQGRIDSIIELAERFDVDGVVYYTLQSCHGYNIERYRVGKALKEANIPMLAIETDYSDADVEQIRIRVEAFLEMLS